MANTVYSMHRAFKLSRRNMSDDAVDVVRSMIVDGQLSAGERVNEVQLAERLGLSRTPLREALGRLEGEGALTSKPHLGFFVAPLSESEYRQLYPIRALLDPEALRLAGIPSEARLHELAALNRQMKRSRDPLTAIALDDQWHLALIDECPNRVLIELSQTFIRRTRRYELALMRDGTNVEISTRQHDEILRVLRNGNLRRACARLRDNMLSGTESVIQWLRSQALRTSKRSSITPEGTSSKAR
jgi:DNA-binding GntR family transcriptional regulator